MIVMVTGKAGSGKDTFFKLAKRYYAYTHVTIRDFAFADKVKEVAYACGWDGNKDDKGRKLLQDVGAIGRAYNKNVWINYILKDIKNLDRGITPIITDLRFSNEYTVIRDTLKEPIYVVKIVGRQSDLGNNANDVSEAGLTEEELGTKFITIDNSGTMEEFEANVNNALMGMGL